MEIGLIPLDERPVNTSYPAMNAAIAGVKLVQPPRKILSNLRQSADCEGLKAWLKEYAPNLDILIVSLEMLGYGGLISSRTSREASLMVMQRLDLLRHLKEAYPDLKLYGFNTITRIPDADDNIEEPLYWDNYGRLIYRFSRLWHQLKSRPINLNELAKVERAIPSSYRQDFLRRRLRNHQVNLHVLEMAAEGIFDLLVISSDDTSPYGMATQEKAWLQEWVERLLGEEGRVLLYPGADEIGCTLLARAISPKKTSFYIHYAEEAARTRIAPYEDGPVSLTVERQIEAVGGRSVSSQEDAALILAVNPPSALNREFDPHSADEERLRRLPFLSSFVKKISLWLRENKRVIVADVAYPNGSDPVLIDLLREQVDLRQLAAYGGWNTAGNTIGTALAQGLISCQIETPPQREAQERFLLHRFLEDWGYQHLVRQEVRNQLQEETGKSEPQAENGQETLLRIEKALQTKLEELPIFAQHWRIKPGSVYLPWQRTFEVDFTLERY